MGLGYQVSAVVNVAARLGIVELLADGPRSSLEMARAKGISPEGLLRFLRACASLDLVAQVDRDLFQLTPLGECLRADRQSLHGFALAMGQVAHLRPFEYLYEGVTECRSVARDALGMEMWEYYQTHPEAKATLTEHLDEVSAELAPHVIANYDLSRFERIVDVGGNEGYFLSTILQAAPQAKGVLLDRPEVMEGARRLLGDRGLADRVEFVGGDFLEEVPAGGDLYLIKGCLHDWNDEAVVKILKNCHRGARPNSTLLSVEGIARSQSPLDPLVQLIDLCMLLFIGGRERTLEDFQSLFEEAGYHIERTIPLPSLGYFPYCLVEAKRR